ncbi:MAG: hypothetical protein NTV52_31990 [Acidobacteria bacterium]|nr:hypothetical protein [Acidobacteriota bacterium]
MFRSILLALIVPVAFAQTPGVLIPDVPAGLIRNQSARSFLDPVPVTAQVIFSAEYMSGLKPGDLITGFQFRSAWNATAAPLNPVNFRDYQITAGRTSGALREISTVFGNNLGPDRTVVRTGPLTLPALSLPGGAAADPYGPVIAFNTPYTYRGGDLIFQVNHTGVGTGEARALTASLVLDSRYGRVVANIGDGSATRGSELIDGAIEVRLRVQGAGPFFSGAGVVNAASGRGNGVSPGLITAIYGVNLGPTELALGGLTADNTRFNTAAGGTRVLFDGVAAPVIYSSQGQISVIAPYSLAGRTTTSVVVESGGVRTEPVTLPVVAALPAMFTANQSGTGQGAILNQDGSVNSAANPAAAGSIIVLFATGEGQTTPTGVDGLLATGTPLPRPVAQPTRVTVGGQEAEVLYSGAAPGLVAGLWQINARLSATVPTGAAVPIVLRVGEGVSIAGVTVAVR